MEQVCPCFICIRLFYKGKLFMTPFCYNSVYKANLLLDHLFRFVAVDEIYIFFIFFNNLFSTFLVKQLVTLCLGWGNSLIFLFNINFCKKLIMAPICIVRFMGRIFYLFIQMKKQTIFFNLEVVSGQTYLWFLCLKQGNFNF